MVIVRLAVVALFVALAGCSTVHRTYTEACDINYKTFLFIPYDRHESCEAQGEQDSKPGEV